MPNGSVVSSHMAYNNENKQQGFVLQFMYFLADLQKKIGCEKCRRI
jgi:hypothetical protein